jgi:hypothetical protein
VGIFRGFLPSQQICKSFIQQTKTSLSKVRNLLSAHPMAALHLPVCVLDASGQTVGQIYWQGKLVSQDLIQAAARLQIASDHGVSEAGTVLDQVQSKMSAAQRQAAKDRFNYLKDRFNQAVNLLEAQKIGSNAMPW